MVDNTKTQLISSLDELLGKDYYLRISSDEEKQELYQEELRRQGRQAVWQNKIQDFFAYTLGLQDNSSERYNNYPDAHLSEITRTIDRKQGQAMWLYDIGPVQQAVIIDQSINIRKAKDLIQPGKTYAHLIFTATSYQNILGEHLHLIGTAHDAHPESQRTKLHDDKEAKLLLVLDYVPTQKTEVLRIAV